MSRVVTEEEFNEWRDHPVTKEVMKLLGAKREELRTAWENGSFMDYTQEGTGLVNTHNLGQCQAFRLVQELTYEQYLGEMQDA